MNLSKTFPAKSGERVDFDSVAAVSRRALPDLLARWLPGGQVLGHEFTVQNPLRGDRHKGNFKINLRTGQWADFAISDQRAKGGDAISLAAYLFGLSQLDAARKLAGMFGLPGGDQRHG